MSGIFLLLTLLDCIEGGPILMHHNAPISGIAAMVHNMVHDEPPNHPHHYGGEEEIWKRLFYSYRSFLQKEMRYNMNLRG